MSEAGVHGSTVLVQDALALCATLTEEEWAQPSGCEGWRVQDVITHMAASFHMLNDPGLQTPPNPGGVTERLNDLIVAERSHWSPEQAFGYYEEQSAAALKSLAVIQAPKFADRQLVMGDVGTYPLSMYSDVVCFDHLCHLALDILGPAGPIRRGPLPLDEQRIAPALDWMLAGIPQMCGTSLARVLTDPLEFNIEGPGARTFQLRSAPGQPRTVVVEPADGSAPAVVSSTSADFLSWATQRTQWQESVSIEGDQASAAAVLERLNVI